MALSLTVRALAVAAALLGGVATGGCGGGDRSDQATGPPKPSGSVSRPPSSIAPSTDPSVNYADPQDVCNRFAATIHRRDTKTDATPIEGYRRAMVLATGTLAATLVYAQHGRDIQWSDLTVHDGYDDVTVEPLTAFDATIPDTPTRISRASIATVTPTGRDGWRGGRLRVAVYCTLVSASAQWRVDGYDTAEPPGGV